MFIMVLRAFEHVVTAVDDGFKALECLNHEPFDLVITGLAMPGIDGEELARRIKERAPAQPILMFTGSQADLSHCANILDGFLRKTCRVADLLDQVATPHIASNALEATTAATSDTLGWQYRHEGD